ncbi:MAG: hypothetical protein WKF79_10980 [Nocardioides sp.]
MYSMRDPYDRDPYDEPAWATHLDRVTHLVLVDGRLVDVWSEPVDGTRWQRHADQFDRERPLPPSPPRPPEYAVALAWLADLCGGPAALSDLDAEPLTDDALDLPETPTLATRHRLERTAELLDSAATSCFDAETGHALRRALLRVWHDEQETALHLRSPAHLAGGVCWAVGKANGLFGGQGVTTQRAVQEALGAPSALSTAGPTIQRALRGFAPTSPARPHGAPDLLALGQPALLLGATRRLLVRLRGRAEEARSAAESGVLP